MPCIKCTKPVKDKDISHHGFCPECWNKEPEETRIRMDKNAGIKPLKLKTNYCSGPFCNEKKAVSLFSINPATNEPYKQCDSCRAYGIKAKAKRKLKMQKAPKPTKDIAMIKCYGPGEGMNKLSPNFSIGPEPFPICDECRKAQDVKPVVIGPADPIDIPSLSGLPKIIEMLEVEYEAQGKKIREAGAMKEKIGGIIQQLEGI